MRSFCVLTRKKLCGNMHLVSRMSQEAFAVKYRK